MSTNNAELTERFVREHLSGCDRGHDWWHISRVRDMALHIREAERKGNENIIEMGALLHEIGDSKFRKQDDPGAGEVISAFLDGLGFDKKQIMEVVRINRFISFSSREKNTKISDEFMIVQDADRLDAIGAIGIARAFTYGGFRNKPIFNPDENSQSQNGSGSGESTIAHFYAKLLKLKGMMNTETGKIIAENRHRYLENYLERFCEEWNMKE
ncbi:MAG: HD domain-containing protein [Bacteroidales bacterium]